MSYILGISCFYHDSAASLIGDDGVLCAAEEERFTRIKHDSSFPKNAINFCLNFKNLNPNDLSAVVFYENPKVKFDRVSKSFIKNLPKSLSIFLDILKGWHSEKFWIKEIICKQLNIDKKKIIFSKHHDSHCFSSHYTSGFKESVSLSIDGVGEFQTLQSKFIDTNNKNENLLSVNFPHSLGLFYSAFTEFLGFEVNEGEFKVMGLAAYGKPIYAEKVEKVFLNRNKTSFELDMDYFSFEYSNHTNLNKSFINEFGEPRKFDSKFLLEDQKSVFDKKISREQMYYADIAASLQSVLEDQILNMTLGLSQKKKSNNITYSGGVAYNGVANDKIIRNSGFKNTYIMPAAGDNGGSIGCALDYYVKNNFSKFKNNFDKFKLDNVYLGPQYDENTCFKLLKNYSFNFEELDNDKLSDKVAELLTKKKVIGVFNGKSEFGPRALGNRSIIADPRTILMKNIINKSIKYREMFRPFAPVVLDSHAIKYFELEGFENQQPYQFMLSVVKVKLEYINKLEAITHVDGTARVQILKKSQNPTLYSIIKKFGDLTGIYALVNTSFNIRGEPIVCTPKDAMDTFTWTNLDNLVLNNFIVHK